MSPPNARRPTSHDIAREVGVSQSTVSRALRLDSRVDPRTAARIVAASKRAGYAPNASARSLVTSRTNTIAVVLADITNPFYPELVETLHEHLARSDYRLVLFNERTDVGGDGAIDAFLRRGAADGAILLSARSSPRTSELLRDSPVPCVLLNRDIEDAATDRVIADNHGGGARVGELLLALGHSRIGLIGGPPDTSTASDREAGLRHALAGAGMALDPLMQRAGEYTHQSGYQAAVELLEAAHRPTALFCANDVVAFGALDAARYLQVEVPSELSIVGFDDIPMAGWESFSLTSVRQPLSDMAREAVRILLERIASGERSQPKRLVFPTQLVQRSTTGAAPGGRRAPHR
jgi:LacI family transcriptional regulator